MNTKIYHVSLISIFDLKNLIIFRHFDCAMAYQNQAEIGEVFQEAFASKKV